MNIEPNYELRSLGNQIALRKLSLPEGEMKLLLIADEKVAASPRKVAGYPFFVLKKGGCLFLCWDIADDLQVSAACNNFTVRGDMLLMNIEKQWFYCTPQNFKKPLLLGQPVSENFLEMFISENSAGGCLHYFENRELKTKEYIKCDILKEVCPNMLLSTEQFDNVLRLQTLDWSYLVSIKKETGPCMYHMKGCTPGGVYYTFTFKKEL
ncbi:MAG: hypothetical protein VZR95_04335 [Alphaproteobacteria bacterium]